MSTKITVEDAIKLVKDYENLDETNAGIIEAVLRFQAVQIAELERQCSNWEAVVKDDCESEDECRKLLATYDKSDSYGVESIADLIEKVLAELDKTKEEYKRLVLAYQKSDNDIQQTLGKALGYPWYKDDQKNFPGAIEKDGVCVGEHVSESIAEEAANYIKKLERILWNR